MRRVIVMMVLVIGACGGDDSGGDDASPDGATARVDTLGETCTGAGTQGSCVDGLRCVNLVDGAWCSKDCAAGDHAACAVGYDGPGLPRCMVRLGAGGLICGVLCEDESLGMCDAATCDGTCPGDLSCTTPIEGGGGTGCQ